VSAPGIPALTRKERTFQRIQEEAMRLFLDKGYEATTVEEIAAAAGVSHMTVFRHFPTKESLVFTDRYDALMLAEIGKRPASEPAVDSIVYAVVDIVVGFSDEELDFARKRSLMIRSVPTLREGIWAQSLISIDVLEQALRTRGRFSEGSRLPRMAARVAMAILTEVSEVWVDERTTRRLDELIREGYAEARSLLLPESLTERD
jgi:AcrR family transcriptional regulator